ncbi:DUF6356 family protein [Sphingomonas aerophila]|jgi:hypothetical protein|uniref:Type 1 capsular polysaccharide biosynthesis protein J n=1 Tax=Sphingomonas aerophila TaxID=1344948 RepID=A0A7W9BC24_9SPHN|nr:DUF6356 family protein [Sphingomonas aerophila]MBB5714071.1 hypothetical protein [Sphingomonas aerophila]
MLDRLFLDHPRSVGEHYGEHALVAGRFGIAMVAGGVACLIHAIVPALFTRTGSNTVRRLHATMSARTPGGAVQQHIPRESPWQLTYEI